MWFSAISVSARHRHLHMYSTNDKREDEMQQQQQQQQQKIMQSSAPVIGHFQNNDSRRIPLFMRTWRRRSNGGVG